MSINSKKENSILKVLKGELSRLEAGSNAAYQQQKQLEKLGLDLDSPSMAFEKGRENGYDNGIVSIRMILNLIESEDK